MERRRNPAAAIAPLLIAQILVHADFPWQVRTSREVGQNYRHVPELGDHRICAIGRALPITARVHMDIGNDTSFGSTAMRPQGPEPPAIEFDNAMAQGIGIDVVIVDELLDRPTLALLTEQKRA
jgi:hypothetical protein